MKPQKNEPCANCKHWSESGCKIGRYNSTAMVIFGACGSFKPKDGYRIVASCDPYNARKHYHGEEVVRREGATPIEWVVRSGLTREKANDVIFGFVRESCGRYFANWGLAVIGAKKAAQGVDCWTYPGGLRGMQDDTMTYRVEKEGWV